MPDRQSRSEPSCADWTVLGTAPDQLTAQLWQGLLEQQGIAAMLAPGDAVSFMGVSSTPCRLLVESAQLEAARALIETGFGPLAALDPSEDAG